MTVIDTGVDPILFYWYDVDTATTKAKIRGRLITHDVRYTSDFDVSNSFNVAKCRWYGDYYTAGGYPILTSKSLVSPKPVTYPVRIRPDGKVHFTRVEYRYPTTRSTCCVQGADPMLSPSCLLRPLFFCWFVNNRRAAREFRCS